MKGYVVPGRKNVSKDQERKDEKPNVWTNNKSVKKSVRCFLSNIKLEEITRYIFLRAF